MKSLKSEASDILDENQTVIINPVSHLASWILNLFQSPHNHGLLRSIREVAHNGHYGPMCGLIQSGFEALKGCRRSDVNSGYKLRLSRNCWWISAPQQYVLRLKQNPQVFFRFCNSLINLSFLKWKSLTTVLEVFSVGFI